MKSFELTEPTENRPKFTIEPHDAHNSLVTSVETRVRNIIPNKPLVSTEQIVNFGRVSFADTLDASGSTIGEPDETSLAG